MLNSILQRKWLENRSSIHFIRLNITEQLDFRSSIKYAVSKLNFQYFKLHSNLKDSSIKFKSILLWCSRNFNFIFLEPKNSDSLDKLMKAFRESGISDIDASKANNLKDVYENWDYLNYVMKEVFRIDGPAIGGLNYYAKEDITLCGIPFNKGFILYPSVIYPHYNPKEWHDPKSFIPERFDPESKYFFKPNSDNQPRHPKSFIPFGFGARNWMGQSLAKLEGKVVLSRILTTIDYEIDQDLLENEYVSYNIISHFKVYGKIKDKISR